jgi:PAS domain S-box-containing protein
MIETAISLSGYTIGTKLYEGTRTRVYRGTRTADGCCVVIKLLRQEYPSFSELVQFRNQYAIAKKLDFPGIVKPYSLEPYRNGYALVMEDVGGISLNEKSAISNFKLEDFLTIAIQLAEILNGIHRHSVIHKDIKPANILINPDTKQVKLIDFSIASQLPKETQEIQNPNVLEGTLAYISPEQTGRMNRGIDYRSDLYSLGVTFYELLSGKLPFLSEDSMELVHCHIAKIPPPLKLEIPRVVSNIVMKLMAKNAEDRYQSALGLKSDLEKCLHQWKDIGEIEYFKLGERDICDRFLIPEKLYGREKEVETLLQAFERVATANPDNSTKPKSELILISGFSGIGKTAVVNEVHKPILRQRGYFIKGKFDQFNRNIPFSAFVQAFRNLMGQLLSENDEQLEEWKSKIITALAENGQVIIDVIPELELIVGKQPSVPELSGSSAQSRFNFLFQKFVRVFATLEHPLVIFMDDLQWADSASLNLMQLLLSDAETTYFLVIGAYRDNEVLPGHPLMLEIDKMQKMGIIISMITLNFLPLEDVNSWVADTLKCSPDLALPLTELVYQKTQGNPFFTTQFLKSLYDDGWITFNRDLRYWQCDIAQVRSLSLSDNVVEFMALQLQKLPQKTQDILKFAACIGNKFDLETLAIVCKQSETETASALWEALKAGLILPQNEIYKFYQDYSKNGDSQPKHFDENKITVVYNFLHDRIQQAAYLLIPDSQKLITHLNIGKLWLKNNDLKQQQDHLFQIVNHLNVGRSLIQDRQELDKLAHLNWIAGQKAKLSTAYTAAIEYLKIGIETLAPNSWESQYHLTLSLHEDLAESAYLNGNLDLLNLQFEIVDKNSLYILDKIKIYEVKIQCLVAQNQLPQAVNFGLQVLNNLNISLVENPTQEDVVSELQKTQTLLRNHSPDRLLNLPEMKDLSKLAAMRILLSIAAAAYISVPNLYVLIVFKLIHLSLKYGNANSSIYGYAAYGLILCGVVGDIEKGFHFGQLSIDLLDRFDAKSLTAKTFVLFNGFIKHWKRHPQETLPALMTGYKIGSNTGDLEFSAYCIFLHFYHCYLIGQNLDSLQKEMSIYNNILQKTKQDTTLHWHQAYWQSVLNLTQELENKSSLKGSAYNEDHKIEIYKKSYEKSGLFHLYFNKLILAYLFEEHDLAIQNAAKARLYLEGVVSLLAIPVFYFYDSLSQLSILKTQASAKRLKLIEPITQNQEKLKIWAEYAPMNHQHKYYLVAAELARIQAQNLEAIELYDRAISGAQENGYIQEEALANELAAKFYLEWGKEKIAKTYMIEAYYGYARWGAKAKVNDLEKRYPQLLAAVFERENIYSISETIVERPIAKTLTNTSLGNSLFLDFAAVLKASQAISEEIELEKLLSTLMQIVLESSGAQKGALILRRNHHWVIEAQVSQSKNSEKSVTLLSGQSIPIESSQEIPHSLIYYTLRMQETLVLDDSTLHPQFAADPYTIRHQLKSVLCVPICQQGHFMGILYLENNLISGAFTRDRIEVLKLLVAQAATSLENSQLYTNLSATTENLKQANEQLKNYSHALESKVEERTIELQQTIDRLEQEISDRQKAETLLRESEQYHRQLFEQSSIGLALCDFQGNLVYINSAYAEIIGYTVEETLNLTYWNITPQKYAPEEAVQLKNLEETGRYGPYKKEYLHKDGHLVPVQLSGILIEKDGKPFIWSSVEDITHRQRQEESLRLIVEGTTAQTGETFFRTFVQHLAQVLQVRYALIAKVDRHDNRYIATTLAFWMGEDLGENFEYDLTGTPCCKVYEIGKLCRYPCAVQPLFPDDPYLVILNIESYVGIPVVDAHGKLQGLVAVLHTEPMDRDLEMQSSILEIFAARAGTEIERMRSEDALRQSQIQLQRQAEQEQLLNSITHQIRNSLNFDTILTTAVQEIRNFLQIDRCHFAWYYHETQDPHWQVVSESRNPDLPDFTGCYPVAAFGPLSEIVLRQDVLRLDDVESVRDPIVRNYVRSLGNQSMLVIPMQSYLGRIGILACIHSHSVRPWCDEELELLQAIMAQLAIALNQAELYDQSCKKAQEIEATLTELKRTQAQLVQSEKMSSLGQMVAGVAHEINNPVSFIAGNIHHAQEYFEDLLDLLSLYQQECPQPSLHLQEKLEDLDVEFLTQDLQKLLKSMKIGSDRIREIVLSLRNFSRLDESEMKEVDLHEGIENTLLILQHRLKGTDKIPAIEINRNYGNLPMVICYASQLNQVFMNILSNALDVLEDAHQRGRESVPKIEIHTEITEKNTVKIAIADNGLGMTEAVRQKLFDPFFTTKPIGKGTGLGLSISYSIIVDKHGGQLTCYSTLGEGTEFVIEIPRQQQPKPS